MGTFWIVKDKVIKLDWENILLTTGISVNFDICVILFIKVQYFQVFTNEKLNFWSIISQGEKKQLRQPFATVNAPATEYSIHSVIATVFTGDSCCS